MKLLEYVGLIIKMFEEEEGGGTREGLYGYPEVGEPCMFGKVIFLSVFYCLGYNKDISTDML